MLFFDLLLNAKEPPTWITSEDLGDFYSMTHQNIQLIATDPYNFPLTYRAIGSYPIWLSVTPDGHLVGQLPLVEEDTDYTITVEVFDGLSVSTRTFHFTVLPAYYLEIIIAENTYNYSLQNTINTLNLDVHVPFVVSFTVNSDVYVGSTDATNTSLDLTTDRTVVLFDFYNNGFVYGAGGRGGNGAPGSSTAGSNGQDGGTALSINYAFNLYNNGTIAGGGGGGGGGGDWSGDGPDNEGGGGGGGAGFNGGLGGYGHNGGWTGTPGGDGNFSGAGYSGGLTIGGDGGIGVSANGDGGKGGDLGQPGITGQPYSSPGGFPGAAGNAIVGYEHANIIELGTIIGPTV